MNKPIELTDSTGTTRAKLLPERGFNCFAFQGQLEGEPIDILWAAESFPQGGGRPSGSGIPLLFPFPGRIQGTTFSWQGRQYSLQEGDRRGNAIHGFVYNRPWRIVDQQADQVTGQFRASQDAPETLQQWPGDFAITVTYQVKPNRLHCQLRMQNLGQEEMPCGLGLHPYFRLPLSRRSSAGACRVVVPVSQRWELENMNITGRVLPLDAARNLAAGLSFADAQLDDVFSGLHFDQGRCVAWVHDPTADRSTVLRFGQEFGACVVFIPPHRQAICIEPYTCVPDAFRLERDGQPAGVRRLGPGEEFTADVTIELLAGQPTMPAG